MCADFHAVALGKLHGLTHVIEIGTMEAASHIGDSNERHDVHIVSHSIEAEGFSHIAINDRHVLLPTSALDFNHAPGLLRRAGDAFHHRNIVNGLFSSYPKFDLSCTGI